jgi:hypothetical protein
LHPLLTHGPHHPIPTAPSHPPLCHNPQHRRVGSTVSPGITVTRYARPPGTVMSLTAAAATARTCSWPPRPSSSSSSPTRLCGPPPRSATRPPGARQEQVDDRADMYPVCRCCGAQCRGAPGFRLRGRRRGRRAAGTLLIPARTADPSAAPMLLPVLHRNPARSGFGAIARARTPLLLVVVE